MIVMVISVVILLIYTIVTYNIIINKLNSVKHTKSTIEVYLMQRFDLIPNLIECVKAYKNYEHKLFENITKLRVEYMDKRELSKGGVLNEEMNKAILILEKYPDLKADKQFTNLQKNLTKMENQIQASRRIYNNEVEKYNTTISIFPNNILAKLLRLKKAEFFQMEGE